MKRNIQTLIASMVMLFTGFTLTYATGSVGKQEVTPRAQQEHNMVSGHAVASGPVSVTETPGALENHETPAPVQAENHAGNKPAVSDAKSATSSSAAPVMKKMSREQKKEMKSDIRNKMKAAKDTRSVKGDDQIIAVLLAIFLCPFGILYWEGATTRFWIDLVLWILGIGGWYFFFYTGLLALAALVLALLVVLEVI